MSAIAVVAHAEHCRHKRQTLGIVNQPLRQRVLRQAVDGLRPGGVLLLTGYTPRQLAFGTGGPKEAALLNEPADLRADLAGLDILRCEEVERDICEGRLHTGRAAVVELVARKPA